VWLTRNGDETATNDMLTDFSSSETMTTNKLLDFQDAINSLSNEKRDNLAPKVLPLLKDSRSGVRLVAIQFLRKVKDRQYISSVIPLLDDDDKLVQYNALMFICSTVHPKLEGCPSTTIFNAHPSKYISEWKAWWITENSKK
jgi:hypothetical protein